MTEEVKGKLTQERCYLVTETERLEQTRHGKMSSDVMTHDNVMGCHKMTL